MARGARIQWAGVAELKKTLEKVGDQLDDRTPEVKEIILQPALATVERARMFAPMKTGLLRASIYATKGGNRQRGVLMGVRKGKNKAWYARFVEFGTVKLAARPFFRPAVLMMLNSFVQDIAPDIKALVEKTAAQNAYHPPG